MGRRIKKLKRIRIHREGTDTLVYSAMALIAIGIILWRSFDSHIPFGIFVVIFGTIWGIVLNFFRCPIRLFGTEETENLVVAPADGRVVVIEKVFEDKYFKEERIMVSIFMSLFNVHANWFPVDGVVKKVDHQNGHFHKAWLPKASDENEMTNVIITTQVDTGEKTADGQPVTKDVDILCRQVAATQKKEVVKKEVVKSYNPGDEINCFSITAGELIMIGRKTGNVYRWANYGDVTQVEYQDLKAEKLNSKSAYIYNPLFVIDDEELLATKDFANVAEVYKDILTIEDIDDIFSLDTISFRKMLQNRFCIRIN